MSTPLGPWADPIFNCDSVSRYPTSGHDLVWNLDLGIGYLHSDGYDYGEEYWQKYLGYRDDFGAALTIARQLFMLETHEMRFIYPTSKVCDVGIGNGEFVEAMMCKGYDVNPHAVEWLKQHCYYGDPYTESFPVLSMWDVLEHIDDPSVLLARTDNVFTSLPIYSGVDACLASKHLRPGEHIWHFTDEGIKSFMHMHGFEFVKSDDCETRLGREGIMSYYFRRYK